MPAKTHRVGHANGSNAQPFFLKGSSRVDSARSATVREVVIPNPQGLHARPVMRFVDLAVKFKASVFVCNVTRRGERVDGKSAMHMMLLEGAKGNTLRIEADGDDACDALDAIVKLVESGFGEM